MADTPRSIGSEPALAFRNTTFSVIERDGQPWLRAAEIAEALGYAREDAISRVYERNAAEFTSQMTETVNLKVSRNGGDLTNEVRIFSLRGAHLIGMFARTELAAEFRRWVLDVLEQHTLAQAAQTPAEHPMAYKRLLVHFDHLGRPGMGQILRDDARVLSVSGMADAIRSPGAGGWSNETLLDLAEAIHTRLASEVRRLAALQLSAASREAHHA